MELWWSHSPNVATILYLSGCHCLPLISRLNTLASSLAFVLFITNIYFLKKTYWLCHLTSSQMLFSIHIAVILSYLPSAVIWKIFWQFLLSHFHSSNQRKECVIIRPECIIINQLITFANLQAWSAFFKSLNPISSLHILSPRHIGLVPWICNVVS